MGRMRENLNQRVRIALTVVGFTCLYTVAIVFFYYNWIFDLAITPDTSVYALCLNGFLCLGAFFTFFMARRMRSETAIFISGLMGYFVAFAVLFFLVSNGGSQLVYLVGMGAGWGAGALISLWFDRAGTLAGNGFALVLGLTSVAATLAALIVDTLSLVVTVGVGVFLIVVSACLLILLSPEKALTPRLPELQSEAAKKEDSVEIITAKQEPKNANAESAYPLNTIKRPWRILVAPLVYVTFLSIIYGVLDAVAMASQSVPASWSGSLSQLGGLVAVLGFLLYMRFGKSRYTTLLNIALAVIATGLLFLPFFGEEYRIALVVVTHMGWELALLVSYALVIEALKEDRRLLIGWGALVFAVPRPGVVVGLGLSEMVAGAEGDAFAQITMVAVALLYLIMTGVWLLRTSEKRSADRAIRKRDELIARYARARDDLYVLACDELAESAHLTKRETELLHLLAQGRDAAYVEKELFLSRNTVKSYTRSLYAKLEVHSKQELIDKVKSSLPVE